MKHLKLTFMLTMLMSVVSIGAMAHGFEVVNADGKTIYYVKTSDTEVAVSFRFDSYYEDENEYVGIINIPENVTYENVVYNVTSIKNGAFRDCKNLTSVIIPRSISKVYGLSFAGCDKLESIVVSNENPIYDSRNNCNAIIETASNILIRGCNNTIIPSDVVSIREDAFYDCRGLASITIPDNIVDIGVDAFKGCSSLTSIIIPNSVTSIRRRVFAYCSGLTSIIIPNSVTSIGSEAFVCCTAIKSITIPDGVMSIGSNVFQKCTALSSISIPNSVTTVGSYAFQGCSKLTSIIIPNSVTEIGGGAFDDTAWFSNQPNGLVYAGKIAYKYKGTMPVNTNIVLEEGTLGVAGSAFNNCSGLTSITIPNSVTNIGGSAFKGCSGLISITIPNGVTSIGNSVFYGCSGLTSITIPNSVTKIDDSAFYSCSGLTSITISKNVTNIGSSAFFGCSGLTTIELSNSLTNIGSSAFYGCSDLTTITIPNNVTSIGFLAFSGCNNLTSVIVEWSAPMFIYNNPFSNNANATLYVPSGSKAAYEMADYWKDFKEIVEYGGPTDISTLDNVIYLDAEEAVTGSQKTLSIKMKNSVAIRGFQFNMMLPEGVTPATYSNGTIMCSLSDARRPEGDQHTISVSKQDDGSYKFLCGSLANETFTGTDGEVLTLKVNIAGDMKAGNYPMTLSTMKLTETNIDNYYETAEVVSKLTVSDCVLGDITGDGTVDVSDYIGVANHILGKTPAGFNAIAADVNGDGVIDISDYIGIANIILTGSIYGK